MLALDFGRSMSWGPCHSHVESRTPQNNPNAGLALNETSETLPTWCHMKPSVSSLLQLEERTRCLPSSCSGCAFCVWFHRPGSTLAAWARHNCTHLKSTSWWFSTKSEREPQMLQNDISLIWWMPAFKWPPIQEVHRVGPCRPVLPFQILYVKVFIFNRFHSLESHGPKASTKWDSHAKCYKMIFLFSHYDFFTAQGTLCHFSSLMFKVSSYSNSSLWKCSFSILLTVLKAMALKHLRTGVHM